MLLVELRKDVDSRGPQAIGSLVLQEDLFETIQLELTFLSIIRENSR